MNLVTMKASLVRMVSIVLVAAVLGIGVAPGGASAAAGTVTIDYANTVATGHPEVFGGNSSKEDAGYMDQIKDIGFTNIRFETYVHVMLAGTNLQDYKNNVGNIQDPSTWDWTLMDSRFAWADHGQKILLLVTKAPTWLTWSGTEVGVPKDWAVYEDIVKKVIQRYKDKITWVEVWNEPDNSSALSLTGSPYDFAHLKDAYNEIFYHVTNAVRAADPLKTIKIGGPALASGTTWPDFISYILQDTRNKDNIDFASMHVYNGTGKISTAVTSWRYWASQYGKSNFPVHVTEWNYDADQAGATGGGTPINTMGEETISYIGLKLNDMFSVGTEGAQLFKSSKYIANYPFWYFYKDGVFSPKAKTYRLMSDKMGLGKGDSNVKFTSSSNITSAQGYINTYGEKLGVLVNSDALVNTATVTMNNTGLENGSAILEIYEASTANDATVYRERKPVTVTNGTITTDISVPANSVVGFKVQLQGDDFGTGTLGAAPGSNWTTLTSGGTVTIANLPNTSNKGLKLSDTSTASRVEATTSFTAQAGTVNLKFSAQAPSSGGGFSLSNSSSILAATVGFDPAAGQIYAYDGATKIYLMAYNTGTTYPFRIVVRPTAGTYDLYIHNTKYVAGKPLRNAVTSVSNVWINTVIAGTGDMYVDDVVVY
ncbi:GH39 family glycosyl hydrolase [Paenibacillus roseipurpureus]|uniref:Glycosyl hydrolase n=1 Tax=Paenibacillus roseopurpureus TaxID=2918901 RepID=A0AA96LRP7_9BACL|nr:glycosyl hydrolase [Paenibacillus sp. MBLB1832]WNR46073.1 glycosyl hydrolase [Paenibacillus sp. MBLB1832]